tara:strand:+ start:158 stop:586 length:429 start_codon:yes stop_codon:yes gene_type:complete
MTEWYCDILGDVVGPLKPSQLLEMVRAGDVSRETLIRKDDSQWVPAMEVNGLFDAASKEVKTKAETLGYICPYCGDPVSKAPTECSNCERHLNRVIPVKQEVKAGQSTAGASKPASAMSGQSRQQKQKLKDLNAWQRFWTMD